MAKHGAYTMVAQAQQLRATGPLETSNSRRQSSGQTPLHPDELLEWLEWSGSKLLAMNIKSPFPREPTAAWPDYAPDKNTAYGYTGERLRPGQPTGFQISLMDQVLQLISLISFVPHRRIVNARSLVTPVANRYLYSWSRLAQMQHTSRYLVIRMHEKGIEEIIGRVPSAKIDAIRQSFLLHKI